MFKALETIIDLLFRRNGNRGHVAIDVPQRREDQSLSAHFSLYELTATSNSALQDQNRTLTDEQVMKLTLLAQHGEAIREICGGAVKVHSGYRSDQLNSSTTGSSSTSQHPRCEALDLEIVGQSLDDTFNKLLAAAKEGKFKFGQLILEMAQRDYGTARWVHCSVIGSLDPAKVGQVLKMVAGSDGKPNYTFVDQIKFL